MLKNKTKEQLLELLYQANNENFSLQLCNDKQSEILKSIAILYRKKGFFARIFNFFAMPWKILQLLKSNNEYFYNLSNPLETMELNKEQCIEATKAILDFENQRVNSQAYKTYITGLLGLPENCGTCGDVSGRLHDDFQKRVNAEIKAKFPELLPTPPTLKSGQFSGETYYKWMQTYHFKGLVELLSKMKTSALNAKSRGVLEQAKLMLDDCERLKEFIQLRKMGLSTGEETTGVVDLDTSEKDILENLDTLQKLVKEYKQEFGKSHADGYDIETLKSVIVKRAGNLQKLSSEIEKELPSEILENLASLMVECAGVQSPSSEKALNLANEIKASLGKEESEMQKSKELGESLLKEFLELDTEGKKSEHGEHLHAEILRIYEVLNSLSEGSGDFLIANIMVKNIPEATTQAAKEKKVYTDEEAYALKNSGGMTLAELGVYYGVDTSTVQRKLKKYEAMLAVDKSDEVL